MKFILRALSLAVALSLAACAKVDENLKPVELVKFQETVKLKKIWSHSVGAGHDRFYNRFRVAALNDRLYAADEKGLVTALDAAKGKSLWTHKLDLGIGGAVGAGGDLVLVGSQKGDVIALNANDGQERWRAQASSAILVPPQTDGETVIALASDGKLFAFDGKTGKKRWSYDHPLPVLTYRTQATPLLLDGQAYVGFDNGQLLSFAVADGQLRWATRVSQPKGRTELERVIDVDSSPIAVGPFVYTASANGRVVAVNRSTGRVTWGQNISTLFDIAGNDEAIFVSGADSHLFAYNANSGELLWENKDLHRRNISAPGLLGNYLAVIDEDDYMHVVKVSDGSFAARIKPPGSGFHSPLITLGDTLLVFSDDGDLSAYRLDTKDGHPAKENSQSKEIPSETPTPPEAETSGNP